MKNKKRPTVQSEKKLLQTPLTIKFKFDSEIMENFTTVKEFESHALSLLDSNVREYYLFSRGDMVKINQEAFDNLRIRPRMLRNVSHVDVSTTILGKQISMPIGVSPTGFQKCAHPDGESANAKAAEAANVIFILSLFSNSSLEEVAKAAPNAIKWCHICLLSDRDFILYVIRKAEKLGFEALVISVDCPVSSKSKFNILNSLSNYNYAIFSDYYTKKSTKEIHEHIVSMIDGSFTWEFISWLKSQTKLPIVVKGVMTAEDALLCVEHGAKAVIVSNHGGRNLHGIDATIEVLPEIVSAVKGKIEVYLDGGVREGLDVFRALALGANMVFMGRPLLWGLVCGGEKGAQAILELLRKDITNIFALAGCSSIEKVTNELVKRRSM